MFRDLQEDIKSLSDNDRETLELLVQVLKNKKSKVINEKRKYKVILN